jgi:hypothetical protein
MGCDGDTLCLMLPIKMWQTMQRCGIVRKDMAGRRKIHMILFVKVLYDIVCEDVASPTELSRTGGKT